MPRCLSMEIKYKKQGKMRQGLGASTMCMEIKYNKQKQWDKGLILSDCMVKSFWEKKKTSRDCIKAKEQSTQRILGKLVVNLHVCSTLKILHYRQHEYHSNNKSKMVYERTYGYKESQTKPNDPQCFVPVSKLLPSIGSLMTQCRDLQFLNLKLYLTYGYT